MLRALEGSIKSPTAYGSPQGAKIGKGKTVN